MLGDYSGVERRRQVRVTAEIPLKVVFGDRVFTFPGAFTRDVSSGGLGIEIDASYSDASAELISYRGLLKIEIAPPDEPPITLSGEVRWGGRASEEDASVSLGIRLVDLDDLQKHRVQGLVKSLVDREYHERMLRRNDENEPPVEPDEEA